MNTIRLTTLLLSIGFATSQAAQITLVSSKDTTIYHEDHGLSNGSGIHLFAGRTAGIGGTTLRRALIGFDLAELPAGATVTEAWVKMNMNKTRGSASDMNLHRLTTGFGEGSSDASSPEGRGARAEDGDATWSDAVLGQSSWYEPGGDFVSEASSVTNVGATGNYTWNSTDRLIADVQLWVDNPDISFGWILIGNEGQTRTAKRFDGRLSQNPPTLTIDFEISSLLGDFSEDGDLNVLDIDLLCGAINGGANPVGFDLNEDGGVSLEDLSTLVEDLMQTFIGDADLNGTVAFADFLQLANNFNNKEGNWSLGDFDCTGTVAFPDFLKLSTNFGKTASQEAALASVPEPSPTWLSIFAVLSTVCQRRKHR